MLLQLRSSFENFDHLLRKCNQDRRVISIQKLNSYFQKSGLNSNDVLCECLGLLLTASSVKSHHLLNRMPSSNERDCDFLIIRLVENGELQNALDLYKTIQDKELTQLSPHAFVALLKACAGMKDVQQGSRLHDVVSKLGLMSCNIFISSMVVCMYVKCGHLQRAQEVFDTLPARNTVSWNVLIAGYVDHLQYEKALEIYQHMHDEGHSADNVTLICSLKACGHVKDISQGQKIYCEIVKRGMENNLVIGCTVLDMYTKCDSFQNAKKLFGLLSNRNEVAWNILITIHVKQGENDEAVNCLKEMSYDGVSPNSVSFINVLKVCCNSGVVEHGHQIHSEIVFRGLEKCTVVGSTLVDMYVTCASILEARYVFDLLEARDAISWNALLAGYVENEYLKDAHECYEKMQSEGIAPDTVTFIYSLKFCDLLTGQEIHSSIVKKGLENGSIIGESVIHMYANFSGLIEAQYMFEKLPIQTLRLWNTILIGYSEHKYYEKTLVCFEMMQSAGFLWDTVTISCISKACGHLGLFDMGLELHVDVAKRGLLETDILAQTSFLEMYVKLGSLGEAQDMFHRLLDKNSNSWNLLITSYVQHGYYEEALCCFEKMQTNAIPCCPSTYVSCLRAFAGIRSVEAGRKLHTHVCKIGLLEKHCSIASAVVDMYAKNSLVMEAENVFENLLYQDSASWNALISGYAGHGLEEDVLLCLQKMNNTGVPKMLSTFIYGLKACSRLGMNILGLEMHGEIVYKGLETNILIVCNLVSMYARPDSTLEAQYLYHAHISSCGFLTLPLSGCVEYSIDTETVRKGFESTISLGNTLIDIYSKAGLLEEANSIFEQLPVRTLVSWNALIAGYYEHGHCNEALEVYRLMKRKSVLGDTGTILIVLKACEAIGEIIESQQIHAEISSRGLDEDILICQSLVLLYTKCELLLEAQYIFHKLPNHLLESWTTLMSGYIENGNAMDAYYCIEEMQNKCTMMDSATYICSLRTFGMTEDIVKGLEVHSEILKRGLLERDSFVSTALVDMYCKCGLLSEAQSVFGKIPSADVVCWTALISGYVENGYGKQALKCFEKMQCHGVVPDILIHTYSISACGSIQALEQGQIIHMEIIKKGLEKCTRIGNALVDMYAECGLLLSAQTVFDSLTIRDVNSWTVLLAGYSEHGHSETALNCLLRMHYDGICPNAISFVYGLVASTERKCMAKGQEVHQEVVIRGLENETLISNSLLDFYSKCNLLAETQEVFNGLVVRDDVSWNTLISMYIQYSLYEEAIDCFNRMKSEHVLPNIVTFLSCLVACGGKQAIQAGQAMHIDITKRGVEEELDIGNSLVDMYVKSGLISDAEIVFDQIKARDSISWNAIISGKAQIGESENVFDLFARMIADGVRPDSVTFISLINACSHTGIVETGMKFFGWITSEFGIDPSVMHYNCIVDLLGRVGCVVEALKVIYIMPFHPSVVVWQTTLGACRKWGNLELGMYAFDHAVELDNKESANYIYILNIYNDSAIEEANT